MDYLTFLLVILSASALSATSIQRKRLYKRQDILAPIVIAVANEDQPQVDKTQRRLVAYLNFENITSTSTISDYSGYENDADIDEDGTIVKIPDSSCGQAALLPDNSAICFKGETFQAKPRKAVTVAAWIKLRKIKGFHSIFDTIGTSHPQGQFHFEVDDGIVRWFHRDEKLTVVFETMAGSVPQGKWTHLAGTYNSFTKQAKIFINGEIRNLTIGDGLLSRDWNVKACIGHHQNGRPLKGYIDEFRIYNYALKQTEIKALVNKCKFEEKALAQKQRSCLNGEKSDNCIQAVPQEVSPISSSSAKSTDTTPSKGNASSGSAPDASSEPSSNGDKAPAKGSQDIKPSNDNDQGGPGGQVKSVAENAPEIGTEGRDFKAESKPEQNDSTGDNVLKKSQVKDQ